jgi:hypothetical protein
MELIGGFEDIRNLPAAIPDVRACRTLQFAETSRFVYQFLNKISHFGSNLGAEVLKCFPDVFDPISKMVHILHDINIRERLLLLQGTDG